MRKNDIKIESEFEIDISELKENMESLFHEYYNNSPWYKKLWLWLRGWRNPKS